MSLTHSELLKLIGEIDGISLRSVGRYTVVVILHLNGEEIELIRDSGTLWDHHVTRIGIASCIEGTG